MEKNSFEEKLKHEYPKNLNFKFKKRFLILLYLY